MAPPKKSVAVEVGAEVFVSQRPLPARVIHIRGHSCEIQFVDGTVAVVHLSSVMQSETSLTISSRSSRTEAAPTKGSGRTAKSPAAKTAKGSTDRGRSQNGSRATTSGKSPGRAPRSPQKEQAQGQASSSQAKKATAKSPARKSPARKSPAKESSTRKAPARKSPARKSPARATTRTSSPAKAAPSKSPARKSTGRKSPVSKSPGRKSVASKSPAKKTPAKTARAASKSPARTTQRTMSVTPARGKKDHPAKTPSPSKVPSERSAASSRSNPLSTTSLAASLPAVTLGNTLTRRSTATSLNAQAACSSSLGLPQHLPAVILGNTLTRRSTATSLNAQACCSSSLGLPQHSSQGIATMQSNSFLGGSINALPSIQHLTAAKFSLEGERGMGDPSKSKKQHLKLRTNGGVPGVSMLGFGRVRVSVRVPPNVLATIRALFWLAFLPSAVVLLYMLCRMEQCTVMEAPAVPKDVASYFRWKLFPGYAGFLLLQALVYALPLGRKVQGFPSKMLMHHTAYEYSLNGWANLLVTVGAFGVLTYYGFPVTIPYRYNLQLLLTILAFANVMSLLLYVKGRWAPWEHVYPPGNIGNRLNDFVEGRELSPRIGKGYDLATLCLRCGLLTWVVLLGSMAWDEYSAPGSFDPGFALSAGCQLLYICMFFFDEEYFLSSAFVTDEGMGYVSVVSKLVLVPFLGVLPPKFLHEQRPPTLPLYCLAFIAGIFLLGLIGMHLAHKRKYRFRRDWPDPNCRGVGVDYLADAYGNRLMMSGLWGLVRHPNYLADLLCHLAFALPCGHHHLLPYYSVITSTVFLVARTIEVEGRCEERYGHLWTRYTEIVEYRLLPFVF
ncbi:delta(14)-sterol reductase LBR-like [Haemaphysalis longicornis]